MNPQRVSVEKLVVRAMVQLHRDGHSWITQPQIAETLGVRSRRLNQSRQEALDRLVANEYVAFRYKPGDARNIRQYHLANPPEYIVEFEEQPTAATETNSRLQQALLEDRYYTALYAYLDRQAGFPKLMQMVPHDLSAEEWLAKAHQLAECLRSDYGISKQAEIDRIVKWVTLEKYEQAWQHIRSEGQRVDALIRDETAV
jgi:hypothetical protein